MLTKVANQDVESTLEQIRQERPDFWPHGLSVQHFHEKGASLYLIKKAGDTAGFVGWQERNEHDAVGGVKKVGYYSIGILPKYRRQGLAKKAVEAVIQEKRANVDVVKASIMEHNAPSKALANSLGVAMELEKAASSSVGKAPAGSNKARAVGAILGALGTSGFFDQVMHSDKEITDTLQPWKWDKERQLMGGLNLLLGGVGGVKLADKKTLTGLSAIAMAPGKDLMMKGIGTLGKVDQTADAAVKAMNGSRGVADVVKSIPRPALYGAGLLGLLGAGGLGMLVKSKLDLDKKRMENETGGRLRVVLPTKKPGDAETTVDMSLQDLNLSESLRSQLKRDTRRRLLQETRERIKRRRPRNPDAPTSAEMDAMAIDEEAQDLDKVAHIFRLLTEEIYKDAATSPQNTGIPMRPNAQPAQAQSMESQAQTIANPQIEQAKQQAQQAQQEAQAQITQLQDQFAQEQMQNQQNFQQTLSQKDEENKALRLQLETAKAEKKLQEAHGKLVAKGKDGESSTVGRILVNRAKSIQQRLKSAAAMSAPETNTGGLLPGNTLQRINDNSGAYTAQGRMAAPNVWRTSYGTIGDTIFNQFIRPTFLRPTPEAYQHITGADVAMNPDKLGVVQHMQNVINQQLGQPQ